MTQTTTKQIQALAAKEARGKLESFSYDPGPLGPEEVEIDVQYCGICHSDVSMLNNEWGMTQYPFVPGHEAAGTVAAVGEQAKNIKVGDRVGLGWNSGSCLYCDQCLRGDHNLCSSLQQTIMGRHGAFGTRVRCHWIWATHIPEQVDLEKVGPLLCGGVTVFNPLVQFGIRPTDRVGVVGIGGLGHLALQFANKWGCHVTAFSSSAGKADDAKKMGAHAVVDSKSKDEFAKVAESFNLIISTVTAKLDLDSYIGTLAPKGHFHTVGVLPEMSMNVFPLLSKQRSVGSSPSGAPATVNMMLDFCGRHDIKPVTEDFAMSDANKAFAHMEAGKARYRVVLKNDLQ